MFFRKLAIIRTVIKTEFVCGSLQAESLIIMATGGEEYGRNQASGAGRDD
jgi:hypothetical protein